jgi:hypothetical protein
MTNTKRSCLRCFQKVKPEKPITDHVSNNDDHYYQGGHQLISSPSSLSATQKPSLKVPDASTSALIESILPLILPIVRKAISKQLIQDGSVLLHEKPLTHIDIDSTSSTAPLPIGPIEVNIENICVMDRQTLQKDMKSNPEFLWPEAEHAMELMKNIPGTGRDMIVLDLLQFSCLIPFGEGIELAFPADLPFGIKGKIEIGSGGEITHPFVELHVPKLRIWFVSKTRKLYVAVLGGRPRLVPNLHVNADRGKGDFLNIVLKEDGNLDEVVEAILLGFGPKPKKTPEGQQKNGSGKDEESSRSWIGNAVGKKISQIVHESMTGKTGGEHRPLEIDLSEAINSSIDMALGKPRSVEAIKADIAILAKELALAIEAETELSGKQEVLEVATGVEEITVNGKSSGVCFGWP